MGLLSTTVEQSKVDFFFQQAEQAEKMGGGLVEIAVASHYIHGKDSTSPLLKEITREIPDWVFANTWVTLYKSWNFDV